MTRPAWLTVTGLALTVGLTVPAAATDAAQGQLEALNRQIMTLQSQMKTLEEKLQKEIKAVDKKIIDAPIVSVDGGKPRFRTPNSTFDVAVRARVHIDNGYYFPDGNSFGDAPDGFNIRRAFLGLTGTVFTDWSFAFMADFAGNRGNAARVQEVSIGYTAFKNWVLEAGALQPSFTLEDSIFANDIPFVERPQTTNLAVSNFASESRTAVGFRHWGDNYRVSAYLTGPTTGTNPGSDDQSAILFRVSARPWSNADGNLHIGFDWGQMFSPSANPGANSPRLYSLSERPENRVGGGIVLVNTGGIDTDSLTVAGAEFGLNYLNFWSYGEYFEYEFDQRVTGAPDLSFDSYYVAAGFFPTGERRQYNVSMGNFPAPKVIAPFSMADGGGIGAWEIAARYSVADLTHDRITVATEGEQSIVTLGVTWYPNNAIRFMLNYQFIDVDRPTGTTVSGEALVGRMQFQF
jgi:phosphate-selective porin OprO and OprP